MTDLIDGAIAELRAHVAARMAPVPLSAVVAGARRRRRIQGATLAAAIALLVAVPVGGYALARHGDVPAPARPFSAANCVPSVLPMPPGIELTGNAIRMDPTGRYVVAAAHRRGVAWSDMVVEWDNGRFSVVPIEHDAYQTTTVYAVNRQGTIVGGAWSPSHRGLGWVVRDGVFSELPGPSGTQTVAERIDDRGDIVGEISDSATTPAMLVMWPAGQPNTFRKLLTLDEANPLAIEDDGTVVANPGGDLQYWNVHDGQRHLAPLPTGYQKWGWETGMARGDWVVGSVVPDHAAGVQFAAIWRIGSDRTVILGTDVTLLGVNTSGIAVGTVLRPDAGIVLAKTTPVVYANGALNTLPTPAGRVGAAWAISDDGSTIAGYDLYSSTHGPALDTTDVLLWHC